MSTSAIGYESNIADKSAEKHDVSGFFGSTLPWSSWSWNATWRCRDQTQRQYSVFPLSSWSTAKGQKPRLQPARIGRPVHEQGQGTQEIRVR